MNNISTRVGATAVGTGQTGASKAGGTTVNAQGSLTSLLEKFRVFTENRHELNRQIDARSGTQMEDVAQMARWEKSLEEIEEGISELARAAVAIPASSLDQLKAKAHFVRELINVEDGDIGERLAFSLANELIALLSRGRDSRSMG